MKMKIAEYYVSLGSLETATTLTATTDKHELKMKMKIAEYYVSLTGIWTTSHLKQTPLVLTGDLRVLRDDS